MKTTRNRFEKHMQRRSLSSICLQRRDWMNKEWDYFYIKWKSGKRSINEHMQKWNHHYKVSSSALEQQLLHNVDQWFVLSDSGAVKKKEIFLDSLVTSEKRSLKSTNRKRSKCSTSTSKLGIYSHRATEKCLEQLSFYLCVSSMNRVKSTNQFCEFFTLIFRSKSTGNLFEILRITT